MHKYIFCSGTFTVTMLVVNKVACMAS